jgi:hypothetical protein
MQSYEAEFRIMQTLVHIPSGKYADLTETPAVRHACVIADVIVDAFIKDVLQLVEKAIKEETANDVGGLDLGKQRTAVRRRQAVDKLLKHKKPLSYEAYDVLVEAVVPVDDDMRNGLLMHEEDYTMLLCIYIQLCVTEFCQI